MAKTKPITVKNFRKTFLQAINWVKNTITNQIQLDIYANKLYARRKALYQQSYERDI